MANWRRLRNGVLGCLVLAFLLVSCLAHLAFASLYGTGNYSSCSYDCVQSTVVTTPTGLQVAINLHNGQVISLKGYTITVTPLNGKGSSFQKVDIYVNNLLATTAFPDRTGTASWFWVPSGTGQFTLNFTITDTNNATTLQQFTVTVKNLTALPATQPATTQKSVVAQVAQRVAQAIQNVTNAITRAVKALPAPVVKSFPYLLFVLLTGDVLLLLLQARREAHEYHTMQLLLERAQIVDESKKTFTNLVSHYLRTPLTVLLGGIDLLSLDKSLVTSSSVDLSAVGTHMRATVEALISQTADVSNQKAFVNATNAPPPAVKPIWQQRALIMPLGVIAIVWPLFDYFASRASKFSGGFFNLATQAVIFSVVALALYQLVRRRQLHQQDKFELGRIIAEEQSVGEARDSIIANAVATLGDDVRRLDKLVTAVGASTAAQSIKTGQQRIREVLDKFAIAARLRGAQSQSPFTNIALRAVLAQPLANIQAKATARGITITEPPETTFATQEPALLSFVLSTLLDNAVTYGPEGKPVAVDAAVNPQDTIITVTDLGGGIKANKIPLLFQPFSKIEGAEVFTHEGMGFSLYLDKLIMDYIGGSISLVSTTKATTVTLQLPSIAAQAPVPTAEPTNNSTTPQA